LFSQSAFLYAKWRIKSGRIGFRWQSHYESRRTLPNSFKPQRLERPRSDAEEIVLNLYNDI
ncbi:MAG: hypothetical protein N4A43_04055, partial [Alphaproteobacteria bacterium]|nr:hypothetical protein [Alphaproteobacteria bacterium]